VESEPFRNVVRPAEPGVRYACPCCRYLTLTTRGWYEICPVCGWEDDGQDYHDAEELRGGANKVSLQEARSNYLAFGHPRSGEDRESGDRMKTSIRKNSGK
jgi:cysteine-rich CPCC protein